MFPYCILVRTISQLIALFLLAAHIRNIRTSDKFLPAARGIFVFMFLFNCFLFVITYFILLIVESTAKVWLNSAIASQGKFI